MDDDDVIEGEFVDLSPPPPQRFEPAPRPAPVIILAPGVPANPPDAPQPREA